MSTITRVKSKNLFSIGNNPIEISLDKHNLTLLSGANGSGKTTSIVDPIHLALFNKPYRNVTKAQCINTINNTESYVEIDIQSGGDLYTIFRGLKPVKFLIYKNGELVDQAASSLDYQEYLENTILGGINEKVFKQIVMMGSAIFTPFMKLTTPNRREFIEELLDIKVFSSMSSIIKGKISDTKTQLQNVDRDISIVREKLQVNEDALKNIVNNSDTKLLDYQSKISVEETNINILNDKIQKSSTEKAELLTKIEKDDIFRSNLNKLQETSIILRNEKQSSQKIVDFFNSNCECPTCKQAIETTYKNGVISDNITKTREIDEKLQNVVNSTSDIKKVVDYFDTVKKTISGLDRDIMTSQNDITSSQKMISLYQREIGNLSNKTDTTDVENKIKQFKNTLNTLNSKKNDLDDEKRYLDMVAGLLKDDGIKTKIIKQYIPTINKIVNEYLVRFGLPIEFTLDEQFNETVKSRYRDKMVYASFSEGEKHRIDMALMLTWRQIARSKNTTNINLLILDEVFDSSLDPTAADEFMNILAEMKDTNIYIISHKNDLTDRVDRVLSFKKSGNFTSMDEQ